MLRNIWLSVLAVGFLAYNASAAAYSIKRIKADPPKELDKKIADLLGDQAVQLVDPKGKVFAEVWMLKELPVKATEAQLQKGLTYDNVPQTSLLAVIRFPEEFRDYRQQRIRPGVYTLRLGNQPMDGDHMGTALYNQFGVLIPARVDRSPAPLKDAEQLHALSTKASNTSHPAIMMLFPNKTPEKEPKVVAKGLGHQVLYFQEEAVADGKKAPLGIGLTVVGHADE
ncbi:MAG: hypothetical protein KatS3mg105_4002 [Gemmatales bacterium]|nr:MAG: hypothetical protein KatS3mg105_4002 [Gemmatales bacterium]